MIHYVHVFESNSYIVCSSDILDLEFELPNDLQKIMSFLKSVELLFLTLLRNVLPNFERRDILIREVLGSFIFYSVLFSAKKVFQLFPEALF